MSYRDDPCRPYFEELPPDLRFGSMGILLVAAAVGTLIPVVGRRYFHLPKTAFGGIKNFGAGALLATSLVHLLGRADAKLTSQCLSGGWRKYPYATAITLVTIFVVLAVEILILRLGRPRAGTTAFDLHNSHDADGSASQTALRPHGRSSFSAGADPSILGDEKHDQAFSQAYAQMEKGERNAHITATSLLYFAVGLQTIFLGIDLVNTREMNALVVVDTFLQLFLGLGLGSRLAVMPLPRKANWVPLFLALFFALFNLVCVGVGLAVPFSYSARQKRSIIANGFVSAIAAGIILYVSLVHLVGRDLVFNRFLIEGSAGDVVVALGSLAAGAGLTALIARWA